MTKTLTMRDTMMQAGAKLKQLREEQHLTQQEMEKRTAARFGHEQRVVAQQVSRIEQGQLTKPPIVDLLRIGQVLGLSGDDIAELYNLWPRQQRRQSAREQLDPRLREAINLAEELPPDAREKFLDWVQFAVLQARAEQRGSSSASRASARRRTEGDAKGRQAPGTPRRETATVE